ncbi:amidohydrolase family protein [Variovorax sp. JS1663]|uniref:amidohydrolase family protein n=1 Tax=Variovorax sp. JS1663 TaxID=1851577 RepID=UPI001EE06F6B|nr:amidohydrolase family protein [Variovorax sp. JS1663]
MCCSKRAWSAGTVLVQAAPNEAETWRLPALADRPTAACAPWSAGPTSPHRTPPRASTGSRRRDHAAKPDIAGGCFEPWATQIERFAAETPALCKLSGLANETGPGWDARRLQPYVDHLLQHVGPMRLMWGSDWPVLNLAGDYLQWHAASDTLLASQSVEAQAAIRGTNAANFYGIK